MNKRRKSVDIEFIWIALAQLNKICSTQTNPAMVENYIGPMINYKIIPPCKPANVLVKRPIVVVAMLQLGKDL